MNQHREKIVISSKPKIDPAPQKPQKEETDICVICGKENTLSKEHAYTLSYVLC